MAAEKLFISQPSISIAIRELEQELGYPLLIRGGKTLIPTPEGESVIERAEIILKEVENIQMLAPKEHPELSGTVRISASPHYCNSVLLEVMLGLKENSPGIILDLHSSGDSAAVSMVEPGEMDIGFIRTAFVDEKSFFKKIEREKIIYEPLFTEEICFVTGENDPLCARD